MIFTFLIYRFLKGWWKICN